MFEYISGNVVYKQPTFVVIDINGLAYRINISLNTFESINNAKQTKLLLHQSIK
ncbi:MAG: Holliday junction branch migration protein RuvA, partial [Bacteroidetes bacterium]|nr:Holliday junction branch migration protein RuvA [Bacteroidota bacterium]